MKRYKTAMIGAAPVFTELLDYLAASERFDLCAVFDKNKIKCSEMAEKYDITGYDDSRQLILSEKPEIIIMTTPNYQAGELIQTAVGLGCHIFKKGPVAREFSEAQSWIFATQKHNCAFGINCMTRNNPIYDRVVKILESQQIGTLYFSSISNFFQYEGVLDWRGEPKMSGGGVLLEGNFDNIDLLTRINGMPERIYATKTDLCKKTSLPPYLTEDTALVTMEYKNKSIANLSCGWMAGTNKLNMSFYGTEGSVHCDNETLKVYDRNNNIIEEQTFVSDEQRVLITQLEHFADHLDNRALDLACDASSFVNSLATINTAYLSSATLTPEEPSMLIDHM